MQNILRLMKPTIVKHIKQKYHFRIEYINITPVSGYPDNGHEMENLSHSTTNMKRLYPFEKKLQKQPH